MKKYYLAVAVIAAISFGAIIWGYVISRGAAADERKVSDIIKLQAAVDNYAQDKGNAPNTLSAVQVDEKTAKRLSDYEYSHTEDRYTICATFKTDASAGSYGYDSPSWHKKGRQCFDADLYIYNYSNDDYLNNYDYDNFQ
ncbi:MAG TPA: hypothetical protein VFB59_05415 [Candidatus Saccharimonadales bacterium]|nr:hypothetical protein [Candidatus Saccharimonadales bacterium]